MAEIPLLVERAPEGGYTARALGDSIFTEADILPELRRMVQDAVHCRFDEGRMRMVICKYSGRRDIAMDRVQQTL